MRLSTIATVAAAAVASLTLIGAGPAPTADAETFYACPSGYSFQVNNGAARCYKAGPTSTQSALCVAPGMTKMRDVVRTADHCKPPGIGATVAVVCPPGFNLQQRQGWDLCRKTSPPSISAPTTPVSR